MAVVHAHQAPSLSQLYVYVTNRCNCTCKHCWIVPGLPEARVQGDHYLSADVFEAAVAEAKPLGLSAVKWTGGEPTIHPGFPSLLIKMRKHGLTGRLETNGMEVTPALARLLRASGATHIAVSLDGASTETHDAIRGVRGAQRRALRGVRILVEAGFAPQIIMSIMRENVAELESLLALAEDVGAGSVKLNIVQPILRGEDVHASGQALSVRELIELNTRLEGEIKSRYPFPIYLDIPMAFRPLGTIVSGDGCSVCGIKTILGLLADGSYALCGIGEALPELVFGMAGEGNLERIWLEHPLLLQLRDGLPGELKGICGRCLMAAACLGSCVAQNYYKSKDLLGPFWFCDVAERGQLFPRTRIRP